MMDEEAILLDEALAAENAVNKNESEVIDQNISLQFLKLLRRVC